MSTTLSGIQAEISASFDESGTPISTSSSEWERRKLFIRAAEREFRDAKRWRFRLKTTTLTASGSTGTDLPSDFKVGYLEVDKAGMIQVGDNFYKLLNYSEKLTKPTDAYVCWVSGDEVAGFELNFSPTIAAGTSIPIQYYSLNMATSTGGTEQEFLDLTSDITLIPNPYFLVARALEKLFLTTGDELQISRTYRSEGDLALEAMKAIEIEESNQVTEVPVLADELGYNIFGSND